MNKKLVELIFISVLSGAVTVSAETLPSFSFDDIVVTATRTSQEKEIIPNVVTVITRDIIEKSGAKNLGELVEGYPGVSMQRVNNRKLISIRGFNARYCLILLDGKRLPAEPEKDFEADRLLLQNIERVEIIKGPLSGLYGSDALGGVINIITRQPDKPALELNFQSGRGNSGHVPNSLFGIAAYTGKIDKFNMNISAETHYDKKLPCSDDTSYSPFGRRNSFSGKVLYNFDERSGLEFDFSYLKEKNHEHGTFLSMMGPLSTDLYNRDSRSLYSLTYTNKGEKDDWFVRVYRSVLHKYNDTMNRRMNNYINAIYAYYSIDGIELQGSHKFNDFNRMTLGGEVRAEEFTGTGIFTGKGLFKKTYHGRTHAGSEDKNTYYGFYLQDELQANPKLFLVGSVRYDGSSELEGRVSPRVGVTYRADENWNVKFNAGQGFKVPTPNQRFLDLFVMRSGIMASVKGNPDLRSEKTDSWDITTEHKFGNGNFSFTYFDNRVKDMIDEVWVSPRAKEYQNIKRARISGVEADLKDVKMGKLRWGVNYTYLNAKDGNTGIRLPNRSRHNITEKISYVPDEKWEVNFLVNTHLGEICEKPSLEKVKKNYTIANLHVNRYFGRKNVLLLGIDNLGNFKDNDLSYAGTTAYVGYRIKF